MFVMLASCNYTFFPSRNLCEILAFISYLTVFFVVIRLHMQCIIQFLTVFLVLVRTVLYRILVRLVSNKNNFDLTFLQNLTTIEVKQSPLFFTRTRGLFRECYPGPKDKAPNHENQGQGDTKKISKY